jgi:hypothetical protein
MAAKKRTRKKARKPARGKKLARKNKPVRRSGRTSASILRRRKGAKPAAQFPEDTLGDWQDPATEEHDEDIHEIGGSE